ncbi:MAG TPA: 16S rRNA (guanine(527)-N(7))-methyltransferase RsmG [Terriglobales bacterium]
MDASRIAAELGPFLSAPLTEAQIAAVSSYMDLLLRWNARVNLTAIRDPNEMLTRHFGESIFAAQYLFPGSQAAASGHLIDLGSGAGFPGLPIKIWAPELRVTLIESNQKKATFLREVVRSLKLTGVEVFVGRAESYVGDRGDVVTLRAVERFEQALPTAAGLVAPGGRLALLIGGAQFERAEQLAAGFKWEKPVAIPLSEARVLAFGSHAG